MSAGTWRIFLYSRPRNSADCKHGIIKVKDGGVGARGDERGTGEKERGRAKEAAKETGDLPP